MSEFGKDVSVTEGRAIHAAAWLMAWRGHAATTGAALERMREKGNYTEADALRIMRHILQEVDNE